MEIELNRINPFYKHPYGQYDKKLYRKTIADLKKKILQGQKFNAVIIQKKQNNRFYNLLDGFCRYMAFKELGFEKIDSKILDL